MAKKYEALIVGSAIDDLDVGPLISERQKDIVCSFIKEGKDLIGGLKAAEAQLRMHEDTLKLISISKAKMIGDLKKILENIEPLS